MRRLLPVLLVLVLALCLAVVVSADRHISTEIVSGPSAAPESVHEEGYEKTVVIYYTNFDDIPDYISFTEYNSQLEAECSGTLSVRSVTRVANMKYEAVFEGCLN